MLKDFNIKQYDSVRSTQDIAKAFCLEGSAKDMDIIVALHQSDGRGRMNRKWVSDYGGLYISVILEVKREVALWPQISYVAGVSVAEAISQLCTTSYPRLKWVNDILLQEQKIGGILLEAVEKFLIIGIGININNEIDPSSMPHAAVLKQFCPKIDRIKLLHNILLRLQNNYAVWLEDGFIPIRSMWLHLAQGISQSIKVAVGSQVHEGIFIGIDNIGRLRLMKPDSTIEYIEAGEMFFDTHK